MLGLWESEVGRGEDAGAEVAGHVVHPGSHFTVQTGLTDPGSVCSRRLFAQHKCPHTVLSSNPEILLSGIN